MGSEGVVDVKEEEDGNLQFISNVYNKIEPRSEVVKLTDEQVNGIIYRYKHAKSGGQITTEKLFAMEQIRSDMAPSFAKAQSQFKSSKQPLNYTPIPSKSFVRSRWPH